METSRLTSLNNINGREDIKTCASLGCSNVGIHSLKVVYINKKGYFCDLHRTELLKDGIVEPIVDKEINAA